VFEKYLFLAVLKRWLLEQSEVRGALMSGSGSTVFAILNDQANVAAIGDRIRGEFGENLWISLCETIGDAGRSVGER
jgi:4-diphosphocytidyl-2-C-methyl-D-erythritol kinase